MARANSTFSITTAGRVGNFSSTRVGLWDGQNKSYVFGRGIGVQPIAAGHMGIRRIESGQIFTQLSLRLTACISDRAPHLRRMGADSKVGGTVERVHFMAARIAACDC